MNCPKADKLSQYVDQVLTELEYAQIQTHVMNCEYCMQVVEMFEGEQEFLIETLQSPTLPDNFAANVLEQLEPYEPKKARQKNKVWQKILLSAAGIVMILGLTATLNPSFAQLIGGLFNTKEVDEGLQIATQAGLGERVNLSVTDQKLTLKIEDIVADSSRVALSYQVVDDKGGTQDTFLNMADSENKVTVIDQHGNQLEDIRSSWMARGSYGLLEFSLQDHQDLAVITIQFDLDELSGKQGRWRLDVPVELLENGKITTVIRLNKADIAHRGVNLNAKEVQFAPSSSEFLYETSFTQEEQLKVKKDIQSLKEQFGEEILDNLPDFGASIQYHIENTKTESVYNHKTYFEGKGHPSNFGIRGSSGKNMEQLGQISWQDSFIPLKEKEPLTFVLDGVFKTVPTNYSIKIKPKELKNKPVSFEYEGNFITITSAKKHNRYSLQKSLIPFEKETTFQIEMEGSKESTASELLTWVLVDESGQVYSTTRSGGVYDEKDEHNRYKTTFTLTTYELSHIPSELTLHLISTTRYEEVKDEVKIPLYEVQGN